MSQIQDDRELVWRIVAEHLDLHSDDTALLTRDAGGGGHVPTVQILFAGSTFYSQDDTSRWCGCIVLKTRRVCCLDGYILYNSFSSPLYTGRERTMEMLMDFHALHRRRVGSVHGRTAHRPL